MDNQDEFSAEAYPEWDVSIPAIPPRSRCYHSTPIGVGTAWVESLTGYVARLAEKHHVLPKTLITHEILPLQSKTAPSLPPYSSVSKFWNSNALSLNGTTAIAREWVETLQMLTGCDNLQYLTMLPWSEVIAMGGVLRPRKAWCPQCYQSWQQAGEVIYDPLLWALNGVEVCLRHQQILVTACPSCHTCPPVLSPIARPGYCSHCTRWLGKTSEEEHTHPISDRGEEYQQHCWKAEAVGEMLAGAPAFLQPPSRAQIAKMLERCLDRYTPGNRSRFARLLDIHHQDIGQYLKGERVPYFATLLQMCFTLAIKPFEFLTANTLSTGNPTWFVIDQLPVVTRGKRKRVTAEAKEQMRLALEQVLAEDIRPRPTLQAVAQRLGHDVTILQKHWPELCEAIVARYRGRPSRGADHHQIQQALEEALNKGGRVALESVAKQLGCSVATLRRHCPDLCRALVERYRTRFDNSLIEQHLQHVMTSSEPVPSLEALARQFSCTTSMLCYRFPALCAAIAVRRRMELHQQHEARMEKVCSEVRQGVLTIHQQGRYPSTRQVAKLLSNPQDIRSNEARETWRIMVAGLGYKGRSSLDKGGEGIASSGHV